MEAGFMWTAARFEGTAVEKQYFSTKEARDAFVAAHPGWKKRGKFCRSNIDAHLAREPGKVTTE